MKKLFSFLALLATSATALANVVKMDLSEALRVHMIEVAASTTGQKYYQRALHLKLNNKSGSTIQLTVNQGAIFQPAEKGYQPLVCAGAEMITLQPFKGGELDVQTFCADADESAPGSALVYNFSKTGSDTLVKLLAYIKKNFLFDELGQKAFWVLTNGNSLSEVYDPAREMQSAKLAEYIVSIAGVPRPSYNVNVGLSTTPGTAVYSPKPLSIHAKFEQLLDAPKTLTLGVFDGEGKLVQEVFTNKQFGRAGHRFTVTFNSSDAPAGKYYIRLKEGETVLEERMVEVR